MAANFIEDKNEDVSVITLGNSGAGKSFICNLLIGKEIFASDFGATSVTTNTRCHRMPCGSFDALIYDVPGLIEADQEHIDRNKREIEKAFTECPNSIVLFVWTHTGGRVVADDIIAFNALNKAYQFSSKSLAFVLNDLPSERSTQYDVRFMVSLASHLKIATVSMEKMFFLEKLKPSDKKNMEEVRMKLRTFMLNLQPRHHQKRGEIVLQLDEIKMLRETLKRKQDEAEKDKQAFDGECAKKVKEYDDFKKQAEEQFEKLLEERAALAREAQADSTRGDTECIEAEHQRRKSMHEFPQQLDIFLSKCKKLEHEYTKAIQKAKGKYDQGFVNLAREHQVDLDGAKAHYEAEKAKLISVFYARIGMKDGERKDHVNHKHQRSEQAGCNCS